MPISKAVIGSAAALVVAIGGSFYVRGSGNPKYVFEGEVFINMPNDGGVLRGTVAGALFTAVLLDGGAFDGGDARTDTSVDAMADARADASLDAAFDAAPDATPDVGPGLDAAGRLEPAYSPAPNSIPVAAKVNTLPLAKPAIGTWVADPNYGVRFRRLQTSGYHDYSQLYAESWDGSQLLLITSEQYRTISATTLMQTSVPTSEWAAPRWLPNGEILYVIGQPLRLMSQLPGSTIKNELMRFPFFAFGKTSQVFEKLSDSGQWTVAMGYQPGDVSHVIMAIDLVNRRVGAQLALDTLFAPGGPCVGDEWGQIVVNWVRPSPSGRWLVVQWNRSGETRCSGAEVFDIETGQFLRRLHDHGNHGDFGVLNGREYYLTNITYSPWNNNYPAIGLEWLDGVGYEYAANSATTKRADTALRMVEWGSFLHASCGRGGPWLCLLSAGPGTVALSGELYLINESGALLRIAKHRSTSCSYWEQPRATMFRSGTGGIFDSDWGTCGQPAPYEVRF